MLRLLVGTCYSPSLFTLTLLITMKAARVHDLRAYEM